MAERTQESIDIANHRLVTSKRRTVLADVDETHPLRPDFDNRHIDRSDRFRIPRSKSTRHLQLFIPTAIRTHSTETRGAGIAPDS